MRTWGNWMRNRFSTAAKYDCMIFIVCLTAISAVISASMPAMADEECGPLGGGSQTITCFAGAYTGTGATEGNAIKYQPSDVFTLNVSNGAIITGVGEDLAPPGNGGGHGIYVRNSVGGVLTVNLADGVVISTMGDATKGAFVLNAGDVTINSGATVDVSTDGALNPLYYGISTAGLFGWNDGAAGTVEITQRAGSTISASGEETIGVYALNGNGSTTLPNTSGDAIVNANGDIAITNGYDSFGAQAWVSHDDVGNAIVRQGAQSTINVQGEHRDSGVYALNDGEGFAFSEVSGKITIDGEEGSGAASVTTGGGRRCHRQARRKN